MKAVIRCFGLFLCVSVFLLMAFPVLARRSGGSGGTETIKVVKCEYAVNVGYVELLIHASSSDAKAHLYAYLPSGSYLGEVQNGSGGRYGGTVFLSFSVPETITIKSSSGAVVTAPCTPFQP